MNTSVVSVTGPEVPRRRVGASVVATLLSVSLLAPGALAAPAAAAKPAKTITEIAAVVRVVDGDTLLVRTLKGKEARVRILGIDTPEVHGMTECWGAEASATVKKMLPVGAKVRLTSDSTQDRVDDYGRQLRYVTRRRDGLDVGRHLLRKGHATTFIWRTNPLKRAAAYQAAERSAKKAKRGLWGVC